MIFDRGALGCGSGQLIGADPAKIRYLSDKRALKGGGEPLRQPDDFESALGDAMVDAERGVADEAISCCMRDTMAIKTAALAGDGGRSVDGEVAALAGDAARVVVLVVARLAFADAKRLTMMVVDLVAARAGNRTRVEALRMATGTEGDGRLTLVNLAAVAPAQAVTAGEGMAAQT